MINYLAHNSIELIVIGIAFCLSRSKMLPGFLIVYVSVMTITFGVNQDYLDLISNKGASWLYYNRELAFVYMYEAFVMTLLSLVSFFSVSKLRAITSIVIFAQALVSLLMAVSVYAYAVELIDLSQWLYDVHYFLQSLFVIIYCVIAWMCVYYSRKMQ